MGGSSNAGMIFCYFWPFLRLFQRDCEAVGIGDMLFGVYLRFQILRVRLG